MEGALGEFALGEFDTGETVTPPPVFTFDRGYQPIAEPRREDDDDIFLAVWMMYMRQPYD